MFRRVNLAGLTRIWPVGLVAVAACGAVLAAVDPGGSYPHMPAGPGLTVDESFNVQEGVRLTEVVPAWIRGELDVYEAFGGPDDLPRRPPPAGYHLPDHPPLGRLWIGIVHNTARSLFPPDDPPDDPAGVFVTACARPASAIAFGLLVLLIGLAADRWYGRTAGIAAALSVVLMPRVFGHAHLAALETSIGLVWAAAVLALAASWGGRGPTLKSAAWCGLVFGLALLTKIQAVLLPVPVAAWALWRWRARALVPLFVWGLVGAATFFALWPWLWLDPLGHLAEYFGRATARAHVNVWYLGDPEAVLMKLDRDGDGTLSKGEFCARAKTDKQKQRLGKQFARLDKDGDEKMTLEEFKSSRSADTRVPWHYPWVMFLATVPVGLHLLGVLGVASGLCRTGSGVFFRSGTTRRQLEEPPPATKRDSRSLRDPFSARGWFVLACLLFPLAVFSVPGVAVYDGARLFLVSFPLWAIFVGRGAAIVLDRLRRRLSRLAAGAALAVFLAAQGWGLVAMRPCHLSYYNLAVGGLWGAERLGLEPTYWGDSLTRDFLRRVAEAVPPGTDVEFVPELHQFQRVELMNNSPVLRRAGLRLISYRGENAAGPRYILFYRRRADLPAWLASPPTAGRLLVEERRQGVLLAGLYFLPP